MDTENTAQRHSGPVVSKFITISGIELQSDKGNKSPFSRQYFVQVSVGATSRRTRSTKEAKNHTSWDESFYFDGDDRSPLLVVVHQKHRVGSDKVVGTLNDTIGGVLDLLKDGVIEKTLSNHTSSGSDPSIMTIKFALAAESHEGLAAGELQATHAVTTAIETVTAISSTPGAVDLFTSMSGSGATAETEVQTFGATWGVLLQRMSLFNTIVTKIAEIHPYASLAWSVISAVNKTLLDQKDRDSAVIRLASAMSDVFDFVENADLLKTIESHIKNITPLIQQVTECGYFIAEYSKETSFLTRTVRYTFSDINAKLANYEKKLQELKTRFLEGITLQTGITVVHTEITVVRMMNTAQNIEEAVVLNDMPYASGARYAQDKGCLPGTRETLLQEICDILNNPADDAPRVCLLTGVAGSGKSAVAHTVARLYDGQRRLGSSFCFASGDIARRNPGNLFSTIARNLSDHDPYYRSALWHVVKDDRALRTSTTPSEQIERFIVEPSAHLDAIGPVVIVIDALDESGGPADRARLLDAISQQISISNFPSNLRFLITTRPEHDIVESLSPYPHVAHKKMGDIATETVNADIEKFIYHSLRRYDELESSWCNQEWCRLLVHRSQGLFQWSATACNFIRGIGGVGLNPRQRLKRVLENDNHAIIRPLDTLYRTILDDLFTRQDTRKSFRDVMTIVLALKEPLPLPSLSAIFNSDEEVDVQAILRPLASLLDGVLDEDKPIRPLHVSFRDFLLDQTRSSTFHVPILPHHHLSLGRALLACMQKMLKFNICDLKDSRRRNSDIPGLSNCINSAIPPHLSYSCLYYMNHLQHVQPTPDLVDHVTLFFKSFFPYWLEVISLISYSSVTPILSASKTCTILQHWSQGQEIAGLAAEAFQFIQLFAPVLKESTPHLYLSAMPQTPHHSPLCQLWLENLMKHASITSEHATWPVDVHILKGHRDYVRAVAYSPDGRFIVSGSDDKTIRVWNATTGQMMAGLHEGHSDHVSCVIFSRDGQYIVSGSYDKTIRVWDAATHQTVGEPFGGHTGRIRSVVVSPDGKHIASGSDDGTIRVWGATSGQTVSRLLGHTDCVRSVAYSPDGNFIVSGSEDRTIRVWNATAGQIVMGALEGHTGAVLSVAYSPDGKHIVSGSGDNTIRIWDAATGQTVVSPLWGHTDKVRTVAYSPDGKYIVSGSDDKTIRVWNATAGQTVIGPIEGHTDYVVSVTYSPDGRYIASGSDDKTVRVWNATTGGQSMTGLLERHTDYVRSVAYSPDGGSIVSGSDDRMVRIWDATTGKRTRGPLEGHVDYVRSVVYSPDGKHIASGSDDKTIRIWDVTTGQTVAGPCKGHTDYIRSVAFSPDSKYIASGSDDRTIRVWQVATGQIVAGPFEGHRKYIDSVAFSPAGNHVVSGSRDMTIRVWHVTTGQTVAGPFEGHTDFVRSVAFSPDGKTIVSGSDDMTIRIWNATTGQTVAGPFQGHTGAINSAVFSPDGRYIASGSEDRTIRIWNTTNGHTVAGPFQGHTSGINSIAYSPDRRYIVSGSGDHSIKLWKIEYFALFDDLEYREDGWIQSSDGSCFFWVVPSHRHDFCLPVHSLTISSYGVYQVNFDFSLFGESWVSCWKLS